PVAVSARQTQTTLNQKKEARIHERVMELLTQVQKRVFDTVTPGKIVEFFKVGEGTPPTLGVRAGDIVAGFYSFLGFTRIISQKGIAKAIATGVEKRLFGYVGGGVPTLGVDGKYQVTPGKARFDTSVALDEIDLESGFVMLPQAIPQPAPAATTGEPGTTTPGTTPTQTNPAIAGQPISETPTSPVAGTLQKLV